MSHAVSTASAATRTVPEPPAIASRPFAIGGVPIPTRFGLAPMAGYTSLAFRAAVRAAGGLGLASTDLVNARSLLENRRRSLELAETDADDRPVAIQIYGASPDEMALAARRVIDLGATIVDINMGCPVRKVVRTGGGSALMCDLAAATTLVAGVVRAADPVPVTVKMRLGWDAETLSAPALSRAFAREGVAAVIIHGRTRSQGFKGHVNRDGIRAVVDAAREVGLLVIGNGDIRTIADADLMFRDTGCDAISIGRGALGNPFLFRQLEAWARTGHPGPEPSFHERIDLMERHFLGLLERRGEHYACLQFRKTVKGYSHLIRPPRALYLQMINLASAARFHEVVALMRDAGPTGALPGHFDPKVPVPTGPIDKW